MHIKIVLHILQYSFKYGHAFYLAKDKCTDVFFINKIGIKRLSGDKIKNCKTGSNFSVCYLGFECSQEACVYCVAWQLHLIKAA